MKLAEELTSGPAENLGQRPCSLGWYGGITSRETWQVQHVDLDLLDLFDPDHLPMDDDETKFQLVHSLRQKLQSLSPGPGRRIILVVKSIGLLARYDAGVKEFYEWFCGDFGMVVLLLDGAAKTSNGPKM